MSDPTQEQELSDFERRCVAYYDGELDAGERANFESQLAVEPEIKASLENWEFVGAMLRGGLEQDADAIPSARFEQIWDRFDETLAREARLQDAANHQPSFWEKVKAAFAPVRVPLAVGAAAAVIAVVAFQVGGGGPDAGAPSMANADEVEAPAPTPAPAIEAPAPDDAAPAPAPDEDTRIAAADPEAGDLNKDPDFPVPESNEAEIERIEFGGRSGTITKIEGTRGTTTVIWVHEDEDPVDSERSL